MDTLKALNTLNALNILNALNLEYGGAMNGHSKCSEHSEFCELVTWSLCEWDTLKAVNTLNTVNS